MSVETNDGQLDPEMADRIASAISQTSSAALREVLAVSFLQRHPRPQIRKRRAIKFDPPQRVAIFANSTLASSRLVASLKRMGFIPLILTVSSRSESWHKTFGRFAQMCFVDLDSFPLSCDPITFCRALREDHPQVPLILMSETFGDDDLSTDRSAVCDASMRWTADRDALTEVISAAQSNNLALRLTEELKPG